MNRLVVLVLVVALSGCASAPSGTAGPSGPQTVTISLPQADPYGGGAGQTEVVTLYRDSRGSRHGIGEAPAQVWPALVRTYNELEIPLGSIEPAQHRLGNNALAVQRRLAGEPISRLLNCGTDGFGSPLADKYQVTVSLITVLEAGEGGTTQMQTWLSGTAINRGVSGAPVHCGTTGRLEERIALTLQRQLHR